MVDLDTLDLEVISEKLLADAFLLRDQPSWDSYFKVMETMIVIGRFLYEQESALDWAKHQILD